MDYLTLLGSFVDDPMTGDGCIETTPTHKAFERDYDRPRLGIPSGFLKAEDYMPDLEKVLDRARRSGLRGGVPKDINPKFRQHLEYFRNHLEIYDIMIDKKVFSVEELWWRSLSERSDFTSYIKKSRAFSLQNFIGLEEVQPSAQIYVHEEYTGYDSIFHESFFPYWDDSSVEDYIYSAIPEKADVYLADNLVKGLFDDYGIIPVEPIVLWLQPIGGKKSMTQEGTTLLKNTWELDKPVGGKLCGRRAVVPTTPGCTRDTAVPDTNTLNILKLYGKAARDVCEQIPYSGNCTYKTLNKRVTRMKRCTWYLHVDFKKFGLTSPRKVINSVLRSLDLEELTIEQFSLVIGEDSYKTTRGTALGWLDPVTSIGVMAILHNLKKREKWKDMDFIEFNDDVEIGFGDIPEAELLIRRDKVLQELESYDFILSHRKIYYSKMMIFLEQYWTPRPIKGLDMRKVQLIIKQYAKSLSSEFAWKAKIHHANASMKVYNSVVSDICWASFPEEKRGNFAYPLELGGWQYFLDNELQGSRVLNCALEDAVQCEMSFFLKMKKYREPHLCPPKDVVKPEDLFRRVQRYHFEASWLPKDCLDRIKYDESKILTSDERHAIEITVHQGAPLDETNQDELEKSYIGTSAIT